ncbi:SWIM zinc finger family protein, partial [Bariatricus massiliensis]|uniref:SWIM zinc finger family protein n=1 Tax=Bariatricus massiliensis TaxID=1745713 RepID=UPI001D091EEF
TTLANPGLLRRAYKDLESYSVEWASNTNDSGRLTIDGQEIVLTAKGIPAATCSCPAPGICKHILAVSIW